MPWKESSVMDERLRFIARLLEGEAMTDLCHAWRSQHPKARPRRNSRWRRCAIERISKERGNEIEATRAVLAWIG